MDIGFLAFMHIIHFREIGPEIIKVAVITVQVNIQQVIAAVIQRIRGFL
jgi:hypothetical protein